MEFTPSQILVWCLPTAALGLLTRAHDFLVLWASPTLRPRNGIDWIVAMLGFFWTFTKWGVGGLFLWAIWNEPALHWYAIGGVAVSVLLWGLVELCFDLTTASQTPGDRPFFIWIYNLRKLISYLWWGLAISTGLWLILLVLVQSNNAVC